MTDARDVTIIGGGYSGTILAAELARRGVSCWLIEKSGRPARGAAYSTDDPAHLLNVRAYNMSAFAGDPDHFLRRFEAIGGERDGFAERRFYGAYLEDILADGQITQEELDSVMGGPHSSRGPGGFGGPGGGHFHIERFGEPAPDDSKPDDSGSDSNSNS